MIFNFIERKTITAGLFGVKAEAPRRISARIIYIGANAAHQSAVAGFRTPAEIKKQTKLDAKLLDAGIGYLLEYNKIRATEQYGESEVARGQRKTLYMRNDKPVKNSAADLPDLLDDEDFDFDEFSDNSSSSKRRAEDKYSNYAGGDRYTN